MTVGLERANQNSFWSSCRPKLVAAMIRSAPGILAEFPGWPGGQMSLALNIYPQPVARFQIMPQSGHASGTRAAVGRLMRSRTPVSPKSEIEGCISRPPENRPCTIRRESV